jgi:hypothetical protein
VSLGLGLIHEIERMGGSDVWVLMRPDALGVSYRKQDKMVRHQVALPHGPTDSAFAVLLDLADEDFDGS